MALLIFLAGRARREPGGRPQRDRSALLRRGPLPAISSKPHPFSTISTSRKYFYEYPTPRNPATITRFQMMIKTTLSGAQETRREITPRAADPKPLTRNFLIANPQLEFLLTHTKQSPLTFSNREYIAVFHFKSSAPSASRSTEEAIRPSLISHPPIMATPARLSRITSHEIRVTAFLIYRPAIRNPRRPLKT